MANWTTADLHRHYQQHGYPEPLKAACGDGGPALTDGAKLSFTIPGAPRTKKTSSRLAFIPAKGGRCPHCGNMCGKDARKCSSCGKRIGFTKILPSEAHEAWFRDAITHAPKIRAELVRAGVSLPLTGDIEVCATFYRDRESGDLLGYEQALADWLQEPKVNDQGKAVRKGAGIIRDDVQVRSWDGSRLAKDSTRPRIEVTLRVLAERPTTGDLFAETEEEW